MFCVDLARGRRRVGSAQEEKLAMIDASIAAARKPSLAADTTIFGERQPVRADSQ